MSILMADERKKERKKENEWMNDWLIERNVGRRKDVFPISFLWEAFREKESANVRVFFSIRVNNLVFL